jgi:diguanylate cyclase (GGDEF)-like protein/PAS domain S-box-containing protein
MWALYCWLTYGEQLAIWTSGFAYLAVIGGWKVLDARKHETAVQAAPAIHELPRPAASDEIRSRCEEAVDGSQIGRWYWDLQDQRLQYSKAWLELSGLAGTPLRGDPQEWYERIHPCDLGKFKDAVSAHLYGSSPMLDCEYRHRRSDGQYRWMLTRGQAGRDADGRPVWMTGTQIDVTELIDVERRSDDAQTDRLTGTLNRRALVLALERACRDAADRPGSVAVLALDLDRFRLVNDSLGLSVGDDTLAAVGKRLLELCDGRAACGRQGGDEFAVVLENLKTPERAVEWAQRFHAEIKRPFLVDRHEIQINASIGVAVHGQAGATSEELLRNAELALQRAKARGPRLATFDDEMRSRALRTYSLRNELTRAAERAEFELYFQPIYRLSDGALVEAEALLRWRRSSGETVGAAEFISLAEETGLIGELGEWSLRTACVARKNWLDEGHGDFRVAVNVSALQLFRKGFPGQVERMLSRTGAPAHLMAVELTESTLVDNLEDASDVLMALSSLGLRLSVDDFGTGYSSLGYVTRFPFSTIKLDRSLLQDITADPRPRAVMQGIISLAHTLQMDITAEGVETVGQLHWLLSHRCDQAQGYLLAKPMPGWQFTEGLRSGALKRYEPIAANVGSAVSAG